MMLKIAGKGIVSEKYDGSGTNDIGQSTKQLLRPAINQSALVEQKKSRFF